MNLKTKTITLRISTSQLAKVDQIAKDCETKRSKVIRKALANGLDECKGKDWWHFYD